MKYKHDIKKHLRKIKSEGTYTPLQIVEMGFPEMTVYKIYRYIGRGQVEAYKETVGTHPRYYINGSDAKKLLLSIYTLEKA